MAKTRRLADADVFPIGLGAMQMSVDGRPDEAQSIRTIHAALDAGVNLIDTADAYCLDGTEVGHNERLIAKALAGRRDDAIVATKGGHTRTADGAWTLDGSPDHLRRACEASLRALGTDRIDLYQLHRPDPRVPYAESIGAVKELQDAGKVRWVGISNASVEQIAQARAIVDVVSVQNELSPRFVSPLAKGEVRACEQAGMAFLPWSPLGGASEAASGPGRFDAIRDAADAHGASPQQVVLAWLLALSDAVIPIPGTRRPETILDSVAAASLSLTSEQVSAISRAAGAA